MILTAFALSACFCAAYGETVRQTMEGGMDVEITHADSVVAGRTFPITVLIQNNGWEDKQNVSLTFDAGSAFTPVLDDSILVPIMHQGGSYGRTLEFAARPDASPGIHFINVDYSQVLLAGNNDPQEPTKTSIAIPITVQERARVSIHTTIPESIFTGAEFPVTVEIISDDADISDVELQILPPQDIQFRGETLHTFSSIQKGSSVSVTSRITTPDQEIAEEYRVPFQIHLTYSDDAGDLITDSETVSTTLRPRTFMELTTDGGIWVGSFFIAPYVSLGTLIGIPAGAILTLIVRRRTGRR